MNKLEQKALRQINLNEGLISLLAKFFLGGKFRDGMRELEKMKKEVDKCILVCSNCHKEIHSAG